MRIDSLQLHDCIIIIIISEQFNNWIVFYKFISSTSYICM